MKFIKLKYQDGDGHTIVKLDNIVRMSKEYNKFKVYAKNYDPITAFHVTKDSYYMLYNLLLSDPTPTTSERCLNCTDCTEDDGGLRCGLGRCKYI